MTDRLTSAFNMLRQGGAIYAGRARLTNWSDNARGMNASFRLDASADPLDNPATNPFKGAHCSPKDGHEFMVLVIPVANGGGEIEPETAQPVEEQGPHGGGGEAVERRKWNELPFSTRAAMLCQEKDANGRNLAARFFAETEPVAWADCEPRFKSSAKDKDAEQADTCLKWLLGIDSKRELNVNQDAATAFDTLSRRFYAWTQEPVS